MRRPIRALASLGGIAVLMSTQLATAAPAQAQTYEQAGTAASSSAQRLAASSPAETEVIRLTNQARQQNGCGVLGYDARVHSAALGHSWDMANNGYYSHISQDGRSPFDRVLATGFFPLGAVGENLMTGQSDPMAVFQAWMNSSGHRANMLNCNYTHIGVGQAHGAHGIYWTMDLVRH